LEEHIIFIFRVAEQAKQETNMKQAAIKAGFILGLHFDPQDGSDLFFPKVSSLSVGSLALYPIRQSFSKDCLLFIYRGSS
jgi:hypothetical protein